MYEDPLATDPGSNGGNFAEVELLSTTEKNSVMEIHYSMLRGSLGFYFTAKMPHRKSAQSDCFEVCVRVLFHIPECIQAPQGGLAQRP